MWANRSLLQELQPKPKVGHEEYFCRFSFRVQKYSNPLKYKNYFF
jgi:hypothetical protein